MSISIFEATAKVSKITEQKYGCSVRFLYFDFDKKLTEEHNELYEIIEKNFGAQFVISKGRILVPVYIDSELFGCIKVEDGLCVDPSLFEDLHSFLDVTLKEFIVKKEKLRRIKIEESLLSASNQNVIPLFKNHPSFSLADYHKAEASSSGWQGALFLSGGDYSQTRTIALEIHSLLNRSSFVPYSSLEFQSSNFSSYLSELGKITIYIPEVIDLSDAESREFCTYIKNLSSKTSPFIILSSQKTLKELENENLLNPDLLSSLREFNLEFNTTSQLKNFYSLILPDPELSPQ